MLETIKKFISSLSGYALNQLLPAALIFVAGLFVIKILLTLFDRAMDKTKLDKAVSALVRSVLRVVLYIILILTVISKMGIDVSSIVTLASVLTLAVSLAIQDALANLIGGFTLLSTKPFALGDYVEIGSQGGTVDQIGLTYTKFLTPDGKTVSIPNSIVDSAEIVNYSAAGTRRVDITVGVSYDNDPDQVLAALKEAAAVETALQTPAPYAAISAYGESTVGYILQVFTTADDYWTTLHSVNRNIQSVFKAQGIQMTYPHLNVHIDQSK